MITRIRIKGFKNLFDVDLRLGPLTCIAGPNGVGKSNLFDGLKFLSDLAQTTLLDAAARVRSAGGRTTDVGALFYRHGSYHAEKMEFIADLVLPQKAIDDLGQEATATHTFVRYTLKLLRRPAGLEIDEEALDYIRLGEAARELGFPAKKVWLNSAIRGRRTQSFISTDIEPGGDHVVKLHQDGGADYGGGGRPKRIPAARMPRTALSTATAAESPTALVTRRAFEALRLLQLEPSALRAPDEFHAPASVDSRGGHMPAALARLAAVRSMPLETATDEQIRHREAVFARVANRLATLAEGIRDVHVDIDERRELLSLVVSDRWGTSVEARGLSDGTLRFLALALLAEDPQSVGTICMEEPENGVHPQRIAAMLALLESLATDIECAVGTDNPLRQVVFNTHSPQVAGLVPNDSLLLATTTATDARSGLRGCQFKFPAAEWRHRADPEAATLSRGELHAFLNATDTQLFDMGQRSPRRQSVREAQLTLFPVSVQIEALAVPSYLGQCPAIGLEHAGPRGGAVVAERVEQVLARRVQERAILGEYDHVVVAVHHDLRGHLRARAAVCLGGHRSHEPPSLVRTNLVMVTEN